MKKIVIADDDFLVRTYLKQLLPWEEMGFVVAGDAKNGKEALTLVQQEQPTLLITDICMPVEWHRSHQRTQGGGALCSYPRTELS